MVTTFSMKISAMGHLARKHYHRQLLTPFSVWKASNKKNKETFAIKVISRKQAESCPNYNVKKEVLIHQSLNHQNIIKMIEARKDEESYYLVLELGLGGELFEKIGTYCHHSIIKLIFYMQNLILVFPKTLHIFISFSS